MNLSSRRIDSWERRAPENPRILLPIPLFKPDIYPTCRIEDPYELEDSPLSSRLTPPPPPPPSQAEKREWHPEGQGTAERKAPVSCLPGSKGPGVEKEGIFRSDLTSPKPCTHIPLNHIIMVVTSPALGCCQMREHTPQKSPGRTTTLDTADQSKGIHNTQEKPFLGVIHGHRKSVKRGEAADLLSQVTQLLPLQNRELASIQLSKLWRRFSEAGGREWGGRDNMDVGAVELEQYRGVAEVAGMEAWPLPHSRARICGSEGLLAPPSDYRFGHLPVPPPPHPPPPCAPERALRRPLSLSSLSSLPQPQDPSTLNPKELVSKHQGPRTPGKRGGEVDRRPDLPLLAPQNRSLTPGQAPINHEPAGMGGAQTPSCLRIRHITPSSPAPTKPIPQGPREQPPSLGLATTPHLWAGVEDLHRNLLGGWVRAPGHAGLLDHGEEPPLRLPARPSRAPLAPKRLSEPRAVRLSQHRIQPPGPACGCPLPAFPPFSGSLFCCRRLLLRP